MTDHLHGKLRTVNMYLNERLYRFFEHLGRGGKWRIRPEYPPPSSEGRHPGAEFRLEGDEDQFRLPCGCHMVREPDDAIAFYSCDAHESIFQGKELHESFAMV